MLTKEALIERRKGIGASDAHKILSGEWYGLWLDKTGRKEPDDLSGVFAVQLGHATEALNLDWMERQETVIIEHRGLVVVSPDHAFLRCTLDGFCHFQGKPTVVQAKHVNPFSKMDEVIARYTPQVIHEMICTRAPQAVLSVIVGCNEPVRTVIPFDEFFATDYIERCREFWGYVERDEEPPQGKPMEIAPLPPVEDMRTVDMSLNNRWASFATDWLENKEASDKFDAAAKALKELVEPDVRRAHGHGIEAVRNKRGLSIRSTT